MNTIKALKYIYFANANGTKTKTAEVKLPVKNINAKAGDPNTFWQGESGLYYTNKKAAIKDDATVSVSPTAYEVQKAKPTTISELMSQMPTLLATNSATQKTTNAKPAAEPVAEQNKVVGINKKYILIGVIALVLAYFLFLKKKR